jgi:hypothetical protein
MRYCPALSAACSADDHQNRTVADEDVAGRRCPQRGAAADLKQGTETLAAFTRSLRNCERHGSRTTIRAVSHTRETDADL